MSLGYIFYMYPAIGITIYRIGICDFPGIHHFKISSIIFQIQTRPLQWPERLCRPEVSDLVLDGRIKRAIPGRQFLCVQD